MENTDAVEVITFGVYGFENDGEHYHPPLKGEKSIDDHHHDERAHHEDEETSSDEQPMSHEEVHETGVEHSH